MACLGLKNQLLPSKKVWNNFTSKVQSKLSKLKRSKALRHAKARLINSIFHSSSRSSYHLRRKKRRTRRLHHHRYFAPVYVDELYDQPMPVHAECVEASPEAKGEKALEKSAKSDQFGVMCGGAAAAAAASSCEPSLSVVAGMEDVDLRAEMFIRKFKEEMRLQRQRSFGEYQEMLARGV
ncbi:uncharacterized protein [Elaeis guineensis]|uniref:Uncharacterized protein LOC105044324 n=1 Tax=Elaeis guineensis var. tenera TaxID=51953 RepID=A0A6I9RB20_ELAGV|nr:uncharacterized protein LOC105044324 [Elaeis guineensis]